jgi:hypothetical protein
MKALRTLRRLSAPERSLVLWTILVVSAIRIALWTASFQRVRSLVERPHRLPIAVSPRMPVSRFVWAVRAASRRVPGATCLTQSLALYCLLTHAGRAAEVHIGVMKDPDRGLVAHAWVEHAGRTLLSGRTETGRYARLLSWGKRPA